MQSRKKKGRRDFIKELICLMRSMTTDCSEIHYKTMRLISDPQKKTKKKKKKIPKVEIFGSCSDFGTTILRLRHLL